MKLPEHLTLSFLLAQFGARQQCGATGTVLMVAAGLLPDLDTLTALGGWRAHRRYHRVLGHGLPMILFGPVALAWFAEGCLGVSEVFVLWCWLEVSLLAHLATDVLFYNWPVQLAWPVSRQGVACGLMTWNDLVPTLILYSGTAAAVLWPAAALPAAALSVTALALYIGWRAWRPRSRKGWSAWLTGDWARRSPRWSRWLTGDFIT
jgi:membrane-bound metal-dependent hydrolase YbcI (DUF457 family)